MDPTAAPQVSAFLCFLQTVCKDAGVLAGRSQLIRAAVALKTGQLSEVWCVMP